MVGAEGGEAHGGAFSQEGGADSGRHTTRAVYSQLKIFLAIALRGVHVFWTVKIAAQDGKKVEISRRLNLSKFSKWVAL